MQYQNQGRPILKSLIAACLVWPAIALAGEKSPAAADEKMPEGFSGSIGLGVISAPRYEGGKKNQTRVMPIPDLNYKIGDLVISTSGVRYTLIENPSFSIGALISGDNGRRDKNSSLILGSDFLKGMGDVKASVTFGVSGSVTVGIPITFSVQKAPNGKGHGGLIADFGTTLPVLITDKWVAGVGLSAQYADQKYMQAYFGVTPLQATTTSFAAYKPKAGFKSVGVSLFSEYNCTKDWSLGASVGLTQLRGDAGKSPIVQKEIGITSGVTMSYKFK